MDNVRKLYRPVGFREMEKIIDAEMKAFPARRPEQPIFYPVLNVEYARQIACKWNAKDPNTGYVGFVTEFDVERPYIDRFEEQVVGASIHRELWVPAEELDDFNKKLKSRIVIIDACYGSGYKGPEPTPTLLKGMTAEQQLPKLAKVLDYNGMDFAFEIATNRKLVQMNIRYWLLHDFVSLGLLPSEKQKVLRAILLVWEEAFPNISLLSHELVEELSKGGRV